MKIGYPCINRTIGCKADRTFRLKSYSEPRLIETVANNLACLEAILERNVEMRALFFRLTSELVPFVSHPICRFDWAGHFREPFARLGRLVKEDDLRISMHPDQFTLINSVDEAIFERSRPFDFDIMLEIKDKEASAQQAIAAAQEDPRVIGRAQAGSELLRQMASPHAGARARDTADRGSHTPSQGRGLTNVPIAAMCR